MDPIAIKVMTNQKHTGQSAFHLSPFRIDGYDLMVL